MIKKKHVKYERKKHQVMWHIVTTPRFIVRSFFLFPCT